MVKGLQETRESIQTEAVIQLNPLFSIEITWPRVPGIASNFLKLALTCISTNSMKLIPRFWLGWFGNSPPRLFRSILSKFGELSHRSVTSDDVGGIWMSFWSTISSGSGRFFSFLTEMHCWAAAPDSPNENCTADWVLSMVQQCLDIYYIVCT